MKRSRATQWAVEDIDWSAELGDGGYGRVLQWHGLLRSEYVVGLSKRAKEQLARQMVAFDYSQILHGEQGAMMLAGQLTNCVDDLDAKLFAAGQVRDEARHVEAVRNLVRRIGPIYPCGAVLKDTLCQLLESTIWPKQVLGLQLFLEARALLSFRQSMLFIDDPVFQDTLIRIERDEAQHVAFGVTYLHRGLEDLSEAELHDVRDYAVWLNQNIWRMTQSEEYRQPFEECNLDFDQFVGSYKAVSRFNFHMTSSERRTVDVMMQAFQAWFLKSLTRTGLIPEDMVARLRTPQTSKFATEGSDPLPWAKDEESPA